ncbi:hypothetical protein GCM10007417_02460 [Glycocaulis alkaliphilus]|nr:hypothetical protein GCM10007417_02460 [Glycocaulis alkaliphilus]
MQIGRRIGGLHGEQYALPGALQQAGLEHILQKPDLLGYGARCDAQLSRSCSKAAAPGGCLEGAQGIKRQERLWRRRGQLSIVQIF